MASTTRGRLHRAQKAGALGQLYITVINKLFSKEFAESGSPAYDVLRNMKLTNEDQEAVAKAIAGDKEDPDQAGQDWVEENRDKVDAWLQ